MDLALDCMCTGCDTVFDRPCIDYDNVFDRPFIWPTIYLTDHLFDRLFIWPTIYLTDHVLIMTMYLTDNVFDRPFIWPTYWPTTRPSSQTLDRACIWLTYWPTIYSTDHLFDRPIDRPPRLSSQTLDRSCIWLTYWLTMYLTDILTDNPVYHHRGMLQTGSWYMIFDRTWFDRASNAIPLLLTLSYITYAGTDPLFTYLTDRPIDWLPMSITGKYICETDPLTGQCPWHIYMLRVSAHLYISVPLPTRPTCL